MPPQDPENYSIDEMMQRLKRRSSSDGDELVTRADGTQMIRKRHRKRRTTQPERKPPRSTQQLRAIQVALVVVLLTVLLVGGFGLLAYHNSSAFIQQTEADLGRLTGAKVQLDKFGISPLRAQAQGVELFWETPGLLHDAQFRNISAQINPIGFIGGTWGGEEVVARDGNLRLTFGNAGAAAPNKEALPYQFMRYRCEKFTAQFGDDPATSLAVVGAEATLYVRSDATQLRLNGGSLNAPGWGLMPLARSHLLAKDGVLELALHASDNLDGKGGIDLTGTFDPRAGSAALTLAASDFPLADLLGKDLSRLIGGRIDATGMVSFDPADFASVELAANFQIGPQQAVTLMGLPIFAHLKQAFQDISLANPTFTTAAEGLIRRSADGIQISALRLEQRNVLAMAGNLAVDPSGKLSGTLEVGIADRLAMLSTSPEVMEPFATRRDGFRWTRITLGGTASAPEDSFVPPAAAAASSQPIPAPGPTPAPKTEAERLEREFQELTR
jgi:hypothetical protein